MKKGIVTTFLGHHLDITDIDLDKIEIIDIAQGLSHCCRYAGQCKFFYSVSQHCINGSYHCEDEDKLAFLLHDGAEAYMGDLVKNVKDLLVNYKSYERGLQLAIYQKFGVADVDWAEIKRIDNAMMAAEAKVLMKNTDSWYFPEDPLATDIILENMNTVKNRYLSLFERYRRL